VATRHDSHAEYVRIGLEKGKTVYVEKPLAISIAELGKIWGALKKTSGSLMVGYNRRFAPLMHALKDHFRDTPSPLTVIFRVNAGHIPTDHWYQDPKQGGRLVGEGCHFVDTCQFLCDSHPDRVYCCAVQDPEKPMQNQDNVMLTLEFANGGKGVVHYLAAGHPAMPKERIEVFGGNACAVLDDFRTLTLYGRGKKRVLRRSFADKGHAQEMNALIEFAAGHTPPPISVESLFHRSLATFSAIESLRTGLPHRVSLSSLETGE
jgi:polar amino acid transport system substrate-binding protein